MAGKRAVRLTTLGDVCHELSKLYNRLNRDEVETHKARAQGYILNLLLNGIKDNDLESRVVELEEYIKDELKK